MSILRPNFISHKQYERSSTKSGPLWVRSLDSLGVVLGAPIAIVACRTTLSRFPARIKIPNEVVISPSLADDTNNLISR